MTGPSPSPWTALDLHPDVVMGVILLAVAWFAAWHVRGIPVSRPHALGFVTALTALLIALNGPLHALAEGYLASAHMVQHVILTQAVAPLLLAATPGWMVDDLLGGPRLSWLGTLARRLTRPLPALAAYAAVLIVWHLPGPYETALRIHPWHVVQHLTLIAASVVAWWPVLSASRLAPALPYGGQILYLFVSGIPMTVVGAMIAIAEDVLYPFYLEAPRIVSLSVLEDQRLAGLIMWVPSGLIPIVAFTAVFFRWAAAEAEDTPRSRSPLPDGSRC